ncbi:SH3 domain-containing protein [Rossellomorea marisflavi]|uniref:SH3 domain-containing protein n=1 Tax=Rossellomorea marisflavi TaxID=189381 RepID=UPI003FA12843
MKQTVKKMGIATGVLLMASGMAPVLDTNSSVLGHFSASKVEASSVTKYKTKDNLNMRTGASTKYKRITTIPKGKQVTYVSKKGSWYKVKFGSKTGYVSSTYLTKVKPVVKKATPAKTTTKTTTKYKTTDNLNMRTGASTKYKRITTIPKGKDVQYLSKSGTWYKVKFGSKTGYVSSTYIKKYSVKTTTATAKKATVTTPKPTVKAPATPTSTATSKTYQTTGNLNMRKGASTKYAVVKVLPKNAKVTYVSKSGSWYKVQYGSKVGWVASSYLKAVSTPKPVAKPAPKPVVKPTPKPVVKPTPKPVEVKPTAPVTPTTPAPPVKTETETEKVKEYQTTGALNMRSGGSTSYGVVTVLPIGATVTYLGKASTGWYKVSYNGKQGYVSPYYLKLVQSGVDTASTYNISLNAMADKQFALHGQTDAYRNKAAYVEKSAIKKSGTKGVIQKTTSVLASDSNFSHVYGTLYKNTNVSILNETKTHYQVYYQTWRNATKADILPMLDPNRFVKGTPEYFQFLDLSKSAEVSASELNKVLIGKGILSGKGQAFIDAGKTHHVNEIYLVSHALLETGQGNSVLATGVTVSSVNGKKVTPKRVYNMFGIGAYDSSALKSGSEFAYQQGWFTPEQAIIGGAKFIGDKYVNHVTYKQNTLYKMRWNPERPGTHQYATDIGWAVKQVYSISNLYKALDDYTLSFDVPNYK